jgi:hypothetical protein
MKRYFILIIILAGILFPFAALSAYSSAYASAFNWVFGTLAAHIIARSILFFSLTTCVLYILSARSKRTAVLAALLVLILVALGQEALQAVSRGVLYVGDSAFDLVVDTVSGGAPVIYFIFEGKT